MIIMKQEINIKHETHKEIWLKFLAIAGILFGYFLFVSMKYGAQQGFVIAWITWAFFVLCTPIADAGFIIDFPIRILFGVKMYISEIIVWVLASFIALVSFKYSSGTFESTGILRLFYHILIEPIPYWAIIIVSAIGTFLSVKFGDELIDVLKHKDREYYQSHLLKWRFLLILAAFIIILIIYDLLLQQLGVKI